MRRLALLVALVLTGSAPVLAAMRTQTVEWTVGDDRFSGVLVYDDAGAAARPGLVMVPNWMGVSQDNIARARDIAGEDYVVLVADVYGKGVLPANQNQARAQVTKVYADGGATLRKRVAAAVDALQTQEGRVPLDPRRIGALGFCFGGSAVLELARSGAELAGVVSIHGGLETHLPTQGNQIRTPVLVLNGADDTSVPDAHTAAFKEEMDAAGADWQFVNFGGARHCFAQEESRPADPADNCRYDERAATRAFTMLRAFFRERFAADQG